MGFFSNLQAQTPLPFDQLGAGPRAIVMGQAFTAVGTIHRLLIMIPEAYFTPVVNIRPLRGRL